MSSTLITLLIGLSNLTFLDRVGFKKADKLIRNILTLVSCRTWEHKTNPDNRKCGSQWVPDRTPNQRDEVVLVARPAQPKLGLGPT
jgi:hypothetical protein